MASNLRVLAVLALICVALCAAGANAQAKPKAKPTKAQLKAELNNMANTITKRYPQYAKYANDFNKYIGLVLNSKYDFSALADATILLPSNTEAEALAKKIPAKSSNIPTIYNITAYHIVSRKYTIITFNPKMARAAALPPVGAAMNQFVDTPIAVPSLCSRWGALTALKTLCLADSPLLILPADIGGLTNLHTLYLKSYRARHLLPPSFTQLASLTRLELHECELAELPDAIGKLRRLQELYLLSCSRIQKLPESVAALLNLEVLVVDKCSSLFSVPTSLMHLATLKQLELTGCALLRKAPKFLPGSLETLRLGSYPEVTHLPGTYALSSLTTFSLSIVIFPSALSRSLSSLEHLRLVLACEGELPFPLADLPRLRTLALMSTGVVKLPDFSTSTLQELRHLELCLAELTEIPSTIAALHKLTYLEINAPKLPSLPDSIGALSRLCKLVLSNCLALAHLPASLTQLACLRELSVHKAAITSLPPNFARLSRLQALDLEGCKQLEALPDDVGKLELLDRVVFTGCDKLLDNQGKPRLPGGHDSYRWMYYHK
ncbi:unnamed protein product [Closterium sp. Naga37s-1]|nr:unnamed protein product [Closterium sp. Naga37s-1]